MGKRKSKFLISFVIISSSVFLLINQGFSLDAVPLGQYLEYARASADWTWQHYDEVIEKWKQHFDPESVFGYRPPGGLLETAVIYTYLYEKEKNAEYAKRARKILLRYGDFRSIYPGWAIKKRTD